MLPATEAKSSRNMKGTEVTDFVSLERRVKVERKCLLSEVNEGLAKEEGLVFCGSLGRKCIPGGTFTSAQCKIVILTTRAPIPPKEWAALVKGSPSSRGADEASCYGFHSCQQSRMERDHAKRESRRRGRAYSIT